MSHMDKRRLYPEFTAHRPIPTVAWQYNQYKTITMRSYACHGVSNYKWNSKASYNWYFVRGIYRSPTIPFFKSQQHCSDVMMGAMASQITSLTIVYSTVYSRRRSTWTSKPRVTALCGGNSSVTGEFPTQKASNAEYVSIDDVIMHQRFIFTNT